ncbi:hypothetical protein [Acinetobacter sp.]|uniref:hypothetical protein n=1 Tax=Acinetobacter sp. TaxID=472 RepID=UPI00388DB2D3
MYTHSTMTQTQQEEIQAAFSKASTALAELEATIRKHHNTPVQNIDKTKFLKLNFPRGYIRTRYHFATEYNLNSLIGNGRQKDSIAYSLMQSDLYNYLINRFEFWGVIQKLLLKGAIINLVSAIEGLLMCSLGHLHQHCRVDDKRVCKNQNRCDFYIKSSKHLKIAGAVDILKDKLVMNDLTILADMITLNNIRNNVHLSILERHEFTNDDYSLANYNKAISVLNYLKTNQAISTRVFAQRRIDGCTGLAPPE